MAPNQTGLPKQAAAHNPWPADHLQVAPSFFLWRAINTKVYQGVDTPLTDEDHHFCLTYHFKSVCNSHCGGRHSHHTMSQADMGRMSTWKDSFCGDEYTVDAGENGSVVSAFTALTNRSFRNRGERGSSGGHWQRSPDGATVYTSAVKGEHAPVLVPHPETGS